MATGQLSPLIQLLHRPAPAREQGDAELLARFARHGDESAFALLLERHGRMVLGLCRRILGDAHEAEDAFQATFLLLVRKAGSLSRPGSLGPWLHGVAYRTALKARAGAARRRGREVQEHDRITPGPVEDIAWRDLRPLLDEAIRGLPHKYRVPFVLCYLEGKSNAQAAEELGCPRGTIATRLSRARDRLRSHLSRCGLTLSAATLTAVLACEASACEVVPASLTRPLAAGGAAHLPPTALALTKGVAQVMFMERMKLVLAALLVAGAAGATVASCLLTGRATAEPPSIKPVRAAVPPPADEEEKPDKPVKHRTINFVVEAPTARVAQLIAEAAERHRKRLARLWLGKELPPWKEPCPIKVKVAASGLGGATTFNFNQGKLVQQEMHLEGPLDGILVNSLPHEITHSILAHHFRCPLPRWADEGAALMTEDVREKKRHEKLLQEMLRNGRAIALRRLLSMQNYPPDVMVLYCQGYSLTRFLVESSSRATFLAFVKDGMKEGWDEAVKTHYNYGSVEKLERAWLLKVSRLPLPPERAGRPARPLLPPGLPATDPPAIGIARLQGEQIVLRNPPVTTYEARQEKFEGRARTYYVPVTRSQDLLYSVKDVQVFGTDGKKVSRKEVARLLAKDRTVVVSLDGRPVDPLYLKVVKEGTLILALPQAQPPQPPPAIAPIPPQDAQAPRYEQAQPAPAVGLPVPVPARPQR